MKSFIGRSFILASALFAAVSAQAAPEIYTIDPGHSYVMFHIDHFGFSSPSGKWMVANGSLTLDEAAPQNSKVDVTIKTADVVTGVPKLDEHLRSPDFFDAVKYPNTTFVSDKVVLTGKESATVNGILTLHGVSKPVVLNVTLHKIGMSPISQKKTAGFAATAKIKRSDFGINAYLPNLGDEVTLNIEVEANVNTPASETTPVAAS